MGTGFTTALAFVYGALAGAMSCILFFFLLFRRVERVLTSTVNRKAHKHAEFDAVAKDAAVVAPAKVETLCKMVRFDGGIVGDAIQCRMVFFGNSIDVYAVDELRTLPDHRQEVVSEHLLGRINRACVVATGQRISQYHRHRNTSTRYAAIKGKCLVLKRKKNLPLFLEDPSTVLKEQLRAVRYQQTHQRLMEHTAHRARQDGVELSGEKLLAEVQRIEAETTRRRLATHRAPFANGFSGLCGLTALGGAYGWCGGAEEAGAVPRHAHSLQRSGKRSASHPVAVAVDEGPLSEWESIAIKFPTRRVQERWLNLLQSTQQSAQWREFIAHLPKADVFNLLIARLFFENSRANTLHDFMEERLKKKLAGVSKTLPQRLSGNIYLDDLDVGGDIPLISNVSDPSPSSCGDTEFDFDMLYRGGLALKIRFAIFYRNIRVPDIIFSIKVLELAGRMRCVVGPPPTHKFWIGGSQPPQLRLEFTQEVASHDGILNAVLRLLPDMSQIASNVVKVMLFGDMVLPNMDDFPWPVLGDDNDSDESATAESSDVEQVEDGRGIDRVSGGTTKHDDGKETAAGGKMGSSGNGGRSPLLPRPTATDGQHSTLAGGTPMVSHRDSLSRGTAEGLVSPPPRPPTSRPAFPHHPEVPSRHPSSSGRGGSDSSSANSRAPTPLPSSLPPSSTQVSDSRREAPLSALPPRPPRTPVTNQSDARA